MDIVHVDVYSPLCVAMCGGSFNFIYTLIEYLSGYMYIYLNKERSMKHLKMFKNFQDEVENSCNKKIKNLWLDHKGRYLSYKFSKHLRVEELFHRLTFPEIP